MNDDIQPRVFIPSIPSRFDTSTRLWIPTVNIDSAKHHGELVIMLPPNANRIDLKSLVDIMRDKMSDFGEEDWVVALGDPSLFAAAACLATAATGGLLRLLKWDRMERTYVGSEIWL